MTHAALIAVVAAFAAFSCRGVTTAPAPLEGTYSLVEENGRPLPADPNAPHGGCCITLSGSLTFTANTYDLRISYRNKNTGVLWDNSEHGTYTRQGSTLSFTSAGFGEFFAFRLGPGSISEDGATVTLLYGDEGPGSDQTRATFRR